MSWVASGDRQQKTRGDKAAKHDYRRDRVVGQADFAFNNCKLRYPAVRTVVIQSGRDRAHGAISTAGNGADSMEQKVQFGEWLKRRRRALDLTQQALADCAGCSLVTIRKFEADERRPSRQLAELLADCLAVPADEREDFITFARQTDAWREIPSVPGAMEAIPAPTTGPSAVGDSSARAVPAPPLSLPMPMSGIIGRDDEIDSVSRLLLRSDVRLVTLTGPGGTGKTRLAIEIARRLAGEYPAAFPDGLYFADLASVSDPALFMPALVDALGIGDQGGDTSAATVRKYLQSRRVLLILDNFEQIDDASSDLADLLRQAGGVTTLLTSRTVLRLYGEYEYPVSPLPLPPSPKTMTPEQLMEFPAIALFVERSRAVRPGFSLTEENAAAVSRICARLDGLPLAIELAAARSKLFSPSALLSQLGSSLDLATGQRHVSDRQQTIRKAIDWSYRLLKPEEQHLFRVLGVFAGDFGLKETGVIAGEFTDGGAAALIERLSGLAEKSMLRQVDFAGEPRFRLLAVLREYALEQLDQRGEIGQYRAAHLDYFCDLAQELGPAMMALSNETARAGLVAANDDLRAAMGWAFDNPSHVTAGLQIAVDLAEFWIQRGMLVEGQNWLRQGLAKLPDDEQLLQARAFIVTGRLAYYQGKFAEGVAAGRNALALLDGVTEEGADHWTIIAHRVVGSSSANQGDYDEALFHQRKILAFYRRRGDFIGVAQTLQGMGLTSVDMGFYDRAVDELTESVALIRMHGGEVDDLLFSVNGLGLAELVRGHYEAAGAALTETLALARSLETPVWEAMALTNLGHLSIPMKEYEEARARFIAGKKLAEETNSRQFAFQAELGLLTLAVLENLPTATVWPHVQACLNYHREQGPHRSRFLRLSDVLALFCARAGQATLAARLWGRAEILRQQPFAPMRFANVQPVYETALALVENGLSPEEFAAARREGAEMAEDDLLRDVEAIGVAAGRTTYGSDHMTTAPDAPAQGERLLAAGGMGEVYLGYDGDGRPIVIKRLRSELVAAEPQVLSRFVREGELLRRLDHPNIVKMLGTREELDGRIAILMEYVPGGTLRDLIERERAVSPPAAVTIGLELADALARAHHLGIIHRDLKPENVLLAADGTPRLTDFGLAFAAREGTRITKAGAVVGTVGYLSPEICMGDQPSPADDLWALGVILAEMLTGRHPFVKDNPAATVLAIISGAGVVLQDDAGVPGEIAAFVTRMLARDPRQRPGSARLVAAALERILEKLSSE